MRDVHLQDIVTINSMVQLARYTLYPLILGGSVVAAQWLSTVFSPAWALNIVTLSVALLLLLLEVLMPYRLRWRPTHRELSTDLSYLGLSLLVLLAVGPVMSAFAFSALWLSAQFDVGLWPHTLPISVQVVLACVVYELASYIFHRLSHTTRLWRLHAVHHSAEQLYWLNSLRNHPLDYFLAIVVTGAPLIVLGCGKEVLALVSVLGIVNMFLQHTNADLRTGFLDWVFVTPTIHRWHHSNLCEQQQCNLGSILVLWDILFRSRLAPVGETSPELVGNGIGTRYPQTLLQQLASPFRDSLWRPSPHDSQPAPTHAPATGASDSRLG